MCLRSALGFKAFNNCASSLPSVTSPLLLTIYLLLHARYLFLGLTSCAVVSNALYVILGLVFVAFVRVTNERARTLDAENNLGLHKDVSIFYGMVRSLNLSSLSVCMCCVWCVSASKNVMKCSPLSRVGQWSLRESSGNYYYYYYYHCHRHRHTRSYRHSYEERDRLTLIVRYTTSVPRLSTSSLVLFPSLSRSLCLSSLSLCACKEAIY
jgi:hypothetical protein